MARARPRTHEAPQRGPKLSAAAEARAILADLERRGSSKERAALARYGIVAEAALGIAVGTLKQLAKQRGRDQALAEALWSSEVYEARMLAAFVGEPERITAARMDHWCRDFDNWAVCDTVCFHLFDRTPHAWNKVDKWSKRQPEYERRAAFALLWGLTVHDKAAEDARYLRGLAAIEAAADDARHYVKKAVNMALRATGKRNPALRAASLATAKRLADSADETARWIGRDALRELTKRS
jgi:3-methyladenine DNA glycosylase AlkD